MHKERGMCAVERSYTCEQMYAKMTFLFRAVNVRRFQVSNPRQHGNKVRILRRFHSIGVKFAVFLNGTRKIEIFHSSNPHSDTFIKRDFVPVQVDKRAALPVLLNFQTVEAFRASP